MNKRRKNKPISDAESKAKADLRDKFNKVYITEGLKGVFNMTASYWMEMRRLSIAVERKNERIKELEHCLRNAAKGAK